MCCFIDETITMDIVLEGFHKRGGLRVRRMTRTSK